MDMRRTVCAMPVVFHEANLRDACVYASIGGHGNRRSSCSEREYHGDEAALAGSFTSPAPGLISNLYDRSWSSLGDAGPIVRSLNSTSRPERSGVQAIGPTKYLSATGNGHNRRMGQTRPSADAWSLRTPFDTVALIQKSRASPSNTPVAQSDRVRVNTLPRHGRPSQYSIPALTQRSSSILAMMPAWSYSSV